MIGKIFLIFTLFFCFSVIVGFPMDIVFADEELKSTGKRGAEPGADAEPAAETPATPEGPQSRIPPLVGQDKNYLKGGKAAQSGGVAATSVVTVLVPKLIKTLLMFAAAMALIFIIYSGWQYVTAMGDENAYGQAKKGILWAIIGLVLTIISYALVDIIAAVSWTG